MAAGNGFIEFSPDTRYGNGVVNLSDNFILAHKFVLDGSGNKEISEIGGYFYRNSGTGTILIHLAIFENDATNDCPSTMVDGSDSGELSFGAGGYLKKSTVYASPFNLVGGSTYWLAVISDLPTSNFAVISSFATGGYLGVTKTGGTYPTWPEDAAWHTHTNMTSDTSLYAVYADAPAEGPTQAQLMRHGTWFGSGVKQRMWWAK